MVDVMFRSEIFDGSRSRDLFGINIASISWIDECMRANVATKPEPVDERTANGEENRKFVVLVVFVRRIVDELGPGITSKTTHLNLFIINIKQSHSWF